MKVTFLGLKGFVVILLTAAEVGTYLLRQQTPLPRLFTSENAKGSNAFRAISHSSPILFAAGWHHGQEQQQHTLAASLAEANAVAEEAAAAPVFNEADCTYPSDDVPFEKVISTEMLRLLLERSPQVSYRGVSTPGEVATVMHKDISCAIQTSRLFHDFCNTNEKATEDDNKFMNLSECLAFLAHAAVHTRSWSTFSDTSRGRDCSVSEKYPCGPPTASYYGRGAFQLRGNEEYGAFGEAVFQDSTRLLNEPELIEPQGIGGWAAALWKWMSERPYGLNCPETMARSGKNSCHAAMLHQDSSAEAVANALRDGDEVALNDAIAGFGLTIHINGGTSLECCPSAVDIFQREGGLLRQNVATPSSTAVAAFSPAVSTGAAVTAEVPDARVNDGQQPAQSANQHLPSPQEQLFRTIMSGGDTSASSPAPAPMQSSNEVPSTDNSLSTSQTVLSGIPAAAPASSVFPAALGGVAPRPLDPPLTAALLLSTFLSFLSVALPDVPPATDENAAAVLHPFSSARVPWPLPLPGSADGLCRMQSVLTLQAAAENAEDRERGRAAALESRFCLSLVRGCPSLFPKTVAQVSSKSTDESAAKAVQEATTKHPDINKVLFKCFETSPAGLAAAITEAASSSRIDLLSDDEKKMKEKLNSVSKSLPAGSFPYLSRNGITCAFFDTKPVGL